jgi:hypothetical protein
LKLITIHFNTIFIGYGYIDDDKHDDEDDEHHDDYDEHDDGDNYDDDYDNEHQPH